jgi:hypothetical protein
MTAGETNTTNTSGFPLLLQIVDNPFANRRLLSKSARSCSSDGSALFSQPTKPRGTIALNFKAEYD